MSDIPESLHDVVVVGSGAGGLAAAVTAAASGCSVRLLEKAGRLGGTTRKSVGAVWLPGNRFIREQGGTDSPEDCLRYLARLARPTRFDPDSATLGLPQWEYDGLASFVRHAAVAHEALEGLGALTLAPPSSLGVVDYLAHLPENTCPNGRTLYPAAAMGGAAGGQELIDGFADVLRGLGGDILTDAAVVGLVQEGQAVVGVEYTHEGMRHEARARKGVVFASGGFSRNEDLRLQFLDAPLSTTCAAPTNTGDFIPMAAEVGAALAAMNEAWLAPGCVRRLVENPNNAFSAFYVLGDAMIMVNRRGRRVVNEKAPYNERARVFRTWDETSLEYPNSPLIAIWDHHDATTWGIDALGNPVADPTTDAPWVVQGDTLEELADAIERELEELRPYLGRAPLHRDFLRNLRSTTEQYTAYAQSGVDPEFQRGETPFERYVSSRFGDGAGVNPMMRGLSTDGPYYATILAMGTLDTKGGPLTTVDGEVLRASGSVIPGLYAVGNCAASPTGQGYPGAGATLGPIITNGFLAGRHVARR